jgi:hypothetical protein
VRRYLVIALLVLAIIGAYLLITTPSHGSSNQTVETEDRRLVITSPLGMTKTEWNGGAIKHDSHRTTVSQTSSFRARLTATGPCYVVHRDEWGDSGTFEHVVRGTGIYHWCVGAAHPENIVSFSHSFDHYETQLWKLNWVETTAGGGVSSTWCTPNGSGPCYPVDYKFFRFRYQYVRGANIQGVDLQEHATFYVQCTVRGNAPGVKPNLECYSDMN